MVAIGNVAAVADAARAQKMQVEEFFTSIPITASESDLRIQVQTDPRYQALIASGTVKEVLGYRMKVASLDHAIQGKVRDYRDDTRRRSKTQKDLADSARIIEAFPELASKISQKARDRLQEK